MASSAASSSPDDDRVMNEWIDGLSPDEMRSVLKYLVLLNAESVQSAMRYVQRGRTTGGGSAGGSAAATASVSASDIPSAGSGGNLEEGAAVGQPDYNGSFLAAPPPLRSKARSSEADDGDDEVPSSHHRRKAAAAAMLSPGSQQPGRSPASPTRTAVSSHSRRQDRSMHELSQPTPPLSNKPKVKRPGAASGFGDSTQALSGVGVVPAAAQNKNWNSSHDTFDSQDLMEDPDTASVSFHPHHGGENGTSNISRPPQVGVVSFVVPNKDLHPKRKTLVVVCSMKPSSLQQAQDQDKSMALCKTVGILPYIVVAESKPQQTIELLAILNPSPQITSFPLFFLQYKQQVEYLGQYDYVESLHRDGKFSPAMLKLPRKTRGAPASRIDQLIRQASDLRLQLDKKPLDAAMMSGGLGGDYVSVGTNDDDSVSTNQSAAAAAAAAAAATPSSVSVPVQKQPMSLHVHLEKTRQPPPPAALSGSATGFTEEVSLGDDLQKIFGAKKLEAAAARGSAYKRARARVPPLPAEGHQSPQEPQQGTDGAASATPAPPQNQAVAASTIHEGEEEDSHAEQDDAAAPAPAPAAASTTNGEMYNNLLSPAKRSDTNPQVTASPGGTWTLRETVTLKPATSRTGDTPPVAPPTEAKVEAELAATKLALKPASLSLARATIETVADSKLAEAIPTPEPKNLPSKKLNVVNPYYALDAYNPSKANSTGEATNEDGETPVLHSSEPAQTASVEPRSTPAEPEAVTPGISSQPAWMQVYEEQEEKQEQATKEGDAASPSRREPQRGVERQKSWEKRFLGIGACYLVYDAVEGELNIHYSEIPIIGAVGVWTSPDILAFKEAQGLSNSELIGNCATQVMTQDRKNYYNGWCQFVKAAKSMDATVTILEVGVPVDFFLYKNGSTVKADGEFETEPIDAAACVPKNTEFPFGLKGKKWTKTAKKLGAVALFRTLSSRDGADVQQAGETQEGSTPLGQSPAVMEMSIPEDAPVEQAKSAAPPTAPHVPPQGGKVAMMQPVEQAPPQEQELPPSPLPPPEHTQQTLQVPPPVAAPEEQQTTVHLPQPPQPQPPKPQAPPRIDVTAPPSTPSATSPTGGVVYPSATATPSPQGGACYLVYEPDSSGRLVEHYSHTPIEGAIGRWIPGGTKKIAGFKFKRNVGRNVLIGNCSAGVQGRKNYCSGWCQFVRSAKVLDGEVMLWDPVGKGMMVDVFLYYSDTRPTHQTMRLQEGAELSTNGLLAVACVPKNTPFFEGMAVDILKWLADGNSYGYSSKM